MKKPFPLYRFHTEFKDLKSLSLWQHKNGNIYGILSFTNIDYLSTARVLYMRIKDCSIWMRPYQRWHESFVLLPDSLLQEDEFYMEDEVCKIKQGSVWADKNLVQNTVIGFANVLTENPLDYPITILYHQRFANSLKSCDLDTWQNTMTKIK